jgi:hypothetical protein
VGRDVRLKQFGDRLRHIVGTAEDARPFVCDGNPLDCGAFIVGINPASSVPFWPFWNDAFGFDRDRWFECYKRTRASACLPPGRIRRQAVSSTRQRIDWIRAPTMKDSADSTKIGYLETNLYTKPTARADDLRRDDRSITVFTFLLAELRPKVLLLHGKEVRQRFERTFGCSLSVQFSAVSVAGQSMMAAAVPHLSRVSRARAEDWAREIRRLCAEAR